MLTTVTSYLPTTGVDLLEEEDNPVAEDRPEDKLDTDSVMEFF